MPRACALTAGALVSLSAGTAPDASLGGPADDGSVPVPGFVVPAPDEHPRLIFRVAQLPEMKKRAETPDGQAIVARLKVMLNGSDGRSLPAKDNPVKAMGKSEPGAFDGQVNVGECFTMWHAAGYGMLFQLSGDKAYAELAKQSVEKMLAGVRDRDNRYSFITPNGALRAGPSLAAMALAYDLGCTGWDPAFKTTVAKAIATYNQGQYMSLSELVQGKRHGPDSNHWGCQIGGGALALLAVRGDAGVDTAAIDALLVQSRAAMAKQLNEGFGETGYYFEHPGPGQIASDTAFVPGLQAWHVAGGRDYYSPRTNARYLTLRFAHWIVPTKGAPWYVNPSPSGSYGTEVFERHGLSRAGHFAQGFFGLSDAEKAALLFVYKTSVEPAEQKIYGTSAALGGKPSYDAITYPHRAVYALANWPIGMAPKNPGEVLPRSTGDRQQGYHVFRNRWQDEDDIIVTAVLGARAKGDNVLTPEVWGLGMRQVAFGGFEPGKNPKADSYTATGDGSGVLVAQGRCLAVDFHPASTCDAVLLFAGAPAKSVGKPKLGDPAKSKTTTATLGSTSVQVMMLSAKGAFPTPAAAGNNLTIGGQVYTFDGKGFSMKEKAGPYAGPVKLNP